MRWEPTSEEGFMIYIVWYVPGCYNSKIQYKSSWSNQGSRKSVPEEEEIPLAIIALQQLHSTLPWTIYSLSSTEKGNFNLGWDVLGSLAWGVVGTPRPSIPGLISGLDNAQQHIHIQSLASYLLNTHQGTPTVSFDLLQS